MLNKSRYFLLIAALLLIASVTIIVILQAADLPNKENNGFVRKFPYNVSTPIVEKGLGEHVKRISGVSNKRLYLSGHSPSWVLELDMHLNVIDTLVYNIQMNAELRDPTITIDSPNLYMYATRIAYILKGQVNSSVLDTLKLDTDLIARIAQISPTRLAIRGIDSTQSKQTFKIMDCENGKVIAENLLVHDQQFGGFETDGILKFDKYSHSIIFIQNYQNSIYCLDTNLNVKFKAHTIDTTFSNGTEVGLVNEDGVTKVMAKRPRLIVNQSFDLYGGYIFVVSGLRGDTEKISSFNTYFPLDIYDVRDGKYVGSVRIPKNEKKRLLDYHITDDFIFALYDGGRCTISKFDFFNLISAKH